MAFKEAQARDPLIELFLDHLKIDKGSSPHTISAYSRDLYQFKKEFPLLLEVTETSVQKFLSILKKKDQKSTSIARKVSSLKQFYQFLVREDSIKDDPTLLIESPVQTKKLPKALSEQNMLALLKAADQGIEYQGKNSPLLRLRDQAMIYLLYATGVRVSELIGIEVSKIDIEAGVVRVLGKRNKERLIPFAPVAGKKVIEYLEKSRPSLHPKSEHLFLGQNGESLTRQGFWKILKKLAHLAGLKAGIHPHQLRHTFATDLLRAGMNLRSLQLLLGHVDLQTTEIYTHIAKDSLNDVVQRFHPRGNGKTRTKS